ncbi:MAG: ATPase, T2SS/T4P/T4SS family [Planctomycetota bacterium]|nr:ATPase, T2SS/T4P/T4SS family [Planctomycetota bacterium]MDP7251203.1 ATPase, T2SS/T4P/T4SS family [Planctomycetota bacterium]
MAKQRIRKPIGEILKDRGLINDQQINEALSIQKENGAVLGTILVELDYASQIDVLEALAAQAGMDVVDIDNIELQPDVIARASASVTQIYRIIPYSFDDNILHVAMADPLNVSALDDLKFMLQCDVHGAVADPDGIDRAIEKYYGTNEESVEDLLDELEGAGGDMPDMEFGQQSRSIDLASLEELANSMPVVKLLNLILLQAIKDKSSDIHFEPFEDEFKVRYRVDGVLYEMMPPPKHLAVAIISRIKVMSLLDISETRLPQDGRIELNISGNPIDLRISTLPTLFGESVVMRVLDRSVISLDLDRIGLREDDTENVRKLLDLPNGIILVTGPTGSGKTTTLYSCLNEANEIDVKIITTEDPVEYDLQGIIQVQINDDIGCTFAACLRSILRQDPDTILVGEIRDIETAQIAIQAALTGHVVLSTLHTNDAPSTVTRMIDMGVEKFMIAATIQGVIAQRLVRTICVECKAEYTPDMEELASIGMTPDDMGGKTFCYGKGCENCNNTGYRGRTALFEMLIMTDAIRDLILGEGITSTIREQATKEGMRTLRQSGLLKIYEGLTTIEEVVRETIVG